MDCEQATGLQLPTRRSRGLYVVIAAGAIARDTMHAVLKLGERLAWSVPVTVGTGLGRKRLVVAIAHFSGRNRTLNDPATRTAASIALRQALHWRHAA